MTQVTENRRDYLESLYQDMSIKELRTLAAERTPDVKSRSKQAYAEALLAWHIAREEQAAVSTAEPVEEVATATEITIYEKNGKTYCEECKPKNGKRGTLVLSGVDHMCDGCGRDLKEMAEEQATKQYDDDTWFAEKVRRDMEEMQASRVAHAQACGFVPQEGDICVNAPYAKYENYQEFSLFRYESGLWVYHTSMQVGIDRYLSGQGYKLVVKFGKYTEGYYSQHEQIEDDDLSPSDLAAIESAMSQEDMDPVTMEELAQIVKAHNELHGNCDCVAHTALDCTALRFGISREQVQAEYGPCACECHHIEQAQKPVVGSLVRLKGSLSKHVWRITRYYSDGYHFVCEMIGEPENTDRERVWNVDDVEVIPEPPQLQKPNAIMLTGLFDAPCSRCHLPTKGRCQECNVPLSPLCANVGRDERMVCLAVSCAVYS